MFHLIWLQKLKLQLHFVLLLESLDRFYLAPEAAEEGFVTEKVLEYMNFALYFNEDSSLKRAILTRQILSRFILCVHSFFIFRDAAILIDF